MRYRRSGYRGGIRRGESARASSFVLRLRAAGLPFFLSAVLGLLLPAVVLAQATTVYLGDTVSSINPGDEDERRLNRPRGSSAVTYTKNTLTGPVTPPTTATQITRTAGGAAMIWYSDPLDEVTISGNVTFNIWAQESHNQANSGMTAELLRAGASGAIQSIIASVHIPADEIGTGPSAQNWVRTPAPTALSNGDRLALRLHIDDAGGNMSANRTVTVTLDGPTAGGSGDSWFRTTEALAPARPVIGSITGLAQTGFSASWTLVEGATGYTLAASVNPGASPSPVYAVAETSENSALLNSPALAPNTTYYPFVRTNGPGASSSWAAFPVQVTPAYAPSFSNFTNISTGSARFNWSANGNHAATLYHVAMSTASDPLAPFGAPVASSFTYNTYLSSAGLAANTAYNFRVAAVNHGGAYTAYTSIVSTYTLAALPAAGAFSGVSEEGITASWSGGGNPAVTLYRLLVSTAPDPALPGGAALTQHETYNLSFSTAGLLANTTYYFRAAGINGDGVAGEYFSPASTSTLAAAPSFSAFSEEAYSSLRFTWTGDNPGGTLYRVLSSTAPDPLAPGGAVAVSSDTYNLSVSSAGLTPDTRYYFRAAAINHNGVATAYTAEENRATLLQNPPALPVFASAASTQLDFGFSANGNAHPGTLFRVLSSTAPDPLDPAGAAVVSSDTYNITLSSAGLAPNTTYYFRVVGVNKDGVLTDYTDKASTSTLAAVPSGLEFTETATDRIRLEWEGTNRPGTLYSALVSTAADPLAPDGAAVTSSDTYNLYLSTEGLAFSTNYSFRVRAVNNNSVLTDWSAIASTTTLAPGTLAAPLAEERIPHISSMTAYWQLSSDATGYTLAASLYPDDPPTDIYTSSAVAAQTSAQVPGLTPDTVYYLFVRAGGDGVASAWSKYTGAATLLQYAPAFGSFGSVTESSTELSWSGGGNPGGTLYRVLSSTAPDPLAPGGAAVISSDTYNLSLASSSLSANTSHYFRIAGVNKDGALTSYTAVRGTSTLANPAVFSGFSGTGTSAMTFSWTGANPAGTLYRVLSSPAPDPLNPGVLPSVSSDTYGLALSTAGLAPNTSYYFRAAAINNDGVLTSWSAPEVNPTLPEDAAFPGFGTVTDSSADFMWSGGANPPDTLYRVLVSPAPDPLNPGAEPVTSSDTYNLYLSSAGLAVDKEYYFMAAALARDGQPGAWTAPDHARTLARQPVFSHFNGVTAAAIGANWTANGNPAGTLYRVAVSPAPDPLNPGAEPATLLGSYGLSVSSSGLAADTTYYFRVAAVNGDGVETAYTAALGTATLAAYPPLFSGFSDLMTDSIRVLWSANGNADGTLYRVAVSTAPDPLAPAGAAVSYYDTYELSYAPAGLLTDTLYYFRLAAVNKNGVATEYTAAQSERTLQTVTKLYLLDDISAANPAGDSGEERRLSPVRGTAAVTYTKDTVGGAVTPPTTATQFTRAAGGAVQTWYTLPLDAVTIVSSVTFNIRAWESVQQANATVTAVLYRTNNSGVIISTVATALIPRTELGTSEAAQTWTREPVPTALNNGDRLALRVYIDDGNAVTMASGRSVYISVGGPAVNAGGDSWLQFLEELRPARPASLSVAGVTASQISASWPLVSETTGYTLASSVNPGGEPEPVYSSSETLGDLSAALATPTLSPNTTYYLFVRSNAPGASSGWQVHGGTATLLAHDPAFAGFSAVASSSLLFDWSANGNADPGTLYRVVSSTAPDPLSPGGAVAVSSLTYNTHLSTAGLAGNTSYYFRVAGLNHNGVATAYTAPVSTATLLAAAPLFSSFSGVGETAIQFSWSANGNAYPGTLFRVLSSTAPDPLNPAGAVAVSSDTYNLFLASAGLAANTTYYFRVAGVNKNGVSTAYTAAAGTATLAYAPAFGSFTGVTAGAVSLDWSDGGNPAGTLYRVLSSTADPLSPLGAAVISSDTYALALSSAGLAADTTYYFSVAALNHNGAATAYTTAAGTATLLGFAPAFTEFTAVAAGSLQFNFSANGNADGTLYRVVSSTAPDPNNPGGAVALSSYTYNTFLSTAGLTADTTYYFSVAGVNKNGAATAYTQARGTATLLGFAPEFTGFTGVAEGSLQFNFSANGNAFPGTLYRVLSSTAPDPLAPDGAAVISSDTYNLALASASLNADTTYYFRAAGVNKNGVLTAYTAAAGTSTLANPPADLYATGITEDAMQLNWYANGNRSPGTLYRVLASTAADPLDPLGAAVTSSDTYNLYLSTPGLLYSTDHYFRARAVNSNGAVSAWTDPPFSARTLDPGAIGSPASGGITGVHVSSLAATWSLVPLATGYTLVASLSPDNPPLSITASSTTVGFDAQAYVSLLVADTVYHLFARANKLGTSGDWYAFPARATLLAYPPAFASFSGVAADAAQFNFDENGNAYPGTKFRVLVSTATDPLSPGAAAFSSSDTYNVALSTAGLYADTTYYFRAAGVNKDGVLTAYTAVQATATPANLPVPSGFTAVGASALTFSWQHNGNRNPGTRYRVLVSTAPDPAAPGTAVVSSSETYNLYLSTAGLAADTTYYFRAAALGVSGVITAYTAPAGTATLAAYPPVFTGFSGVGTGAIQFNWSANGNRNPGTRYRVLVSTAANPLSPAGAVVTSSETYNLYLSSASLTPNATRYFTAAAVNHNGVLTDWTAAAGTATLANIPLTAVSTFSAVTSGGFTAAWAANSNPAGTLYQVQVSTAQDFNTGAAGQTASTAPVSGQSYSFSGLLSSRDYYFRARARNLNGVYTGYAALGSTRTLGLAAPVPLPVTQVSTYSITASWSLVEGATGYTLAASLNSANPPSPVYASSATAGTSAVLASPALALNTTYYLYVKAGGPGDASPWAVYPATSTLANAPAAPGSPFGTVTDNSFTLSWLANSNPLGATRYTVQVSTALDFNSGVTDQVLITTAPAAGPGATFSGLNSDTYYYARVRAQHNNGNFTDWVSLGFAKTLILAELHDSGDGVLVYGQAGNSMPQFRNYVSASNSFSPVRPTISGAAGKLFTVRTNPLTTKQEAVAAYVSNGTLRVLCTDGANWYEEWTQTVGGADATRRFDIAFESGSGDVLVLYSRGVAGTNELGYRTKPGAAGCGPGNWSGAQTLDPVRTSGAVHWVKMAPDRRADRDNIAAIWADANSDLSAMVWNGAGWENEPASALETSLEIVSAAQDVESFAVETESLSGDIMVAWGHSGGSDGVNGVRYATAAFTGATPAHAWGSPVSAPTFLDDATSLDLAANPASDELVFASIGNAGADLQAGYWSGSAWTNTANLDITAQAPIAGAKLVAAAWISSGTATRSVIIYNDAAAANLGWYVGNGGTFTAQADFTPAPAFANPQRYYDLKQDPVFRDRLLFTLSDSNADLFAKRLVMTSAAAFTWTNADGGAALEPNLGSGLAGGYSFVFWPAPPTTTFEASAFRFFANTDTADVGAPLAPQDALGVLPAAGAAFRLRALATIGQVDLPISGQSFKLQFAGQGDGTCAAPSNGVPAAWTDVTALTAVAFNNNLSVADGAALAANAADPLYGVQANIDQTYAEANGFSNSVAGINRNRSGMWDLALKDNGMAPGAVYCLRLVKGDGLPLEYYTAYPRVVSPSAVVLNEVYPSGASASEDWVELYNNSESTAPLSGWKLEYVENTIALGGSANTVWTGQSGQYVNARSTFLITGLSLDLNGAQAYHVKLLDAAGALADQVQWPGPGVLSPGQSFARISDGHPDNFEIDPTPTRGYANYVSTDALAINEVAYGALETQFIELYNSGAVSARLLQGYTLRNAASSAAGKVFRFTKIIYPQDFAAVDGSSADDEAASYASVFGTSGLAAAGDFLALENSSGSTVSHLAWQSGSAYTRYNYSGQVTSYANPAPAAAAHSIVRGPADGAHTGVDSADFTASTGTTLGARNNNAGTAASNTLAYPDPAASPRYLSRVFPLRLTLAEDNSAGRASLVFARVGGAADPGSPHIYRLQDSGFSLAAPGAPQSAVKLGQEFYDQDGLPLVSGAYYRFILNSDTGAASAPQVVIASAAYDAAVHSVSAAGPASASLVNDDVRTGAVRVDLSNNSPAGFNGVEIATVAFTLLRDDLVTPLTTAEAGGLFDAVMLVGDSTSTGLSGTYEPAIDVATAAYVPMAEITLDAAGLSTLTVPVPGLDAAFVTAGSTRSFYLVFASTRNASSKSPAAFRVRFVPAGGAQIRDASGLLGQVYTPAAQVDTASFTFIAPALPPEETDWPYVSESSSPITGAISFYENYSSLLPEARGYLPSTDGTLVAVSTTGAPLWTFTTSPQTSLAVAPSLPQEEGGGVYLYFAGDNGDVYKLRDEGGTAAQAWKTSLGARASSVLDTASRLYIPTADGKVHCLNRSDGLACSGWTFSSALTAAPAGTPSVDERATVATVWIGLEDGKLVSLKTGDGTSNTTFTTGGPVAGSPFFDAYVASADNALYLTSTDGKIYAVNSGNMTPMSGWNDYDTGSAIHTSPFVWSLGGTKYAFFGADNGKLYKINAGTGELAWAFQAGGAVRSSPVVVPAWYVGLGAGEDYVYFGSDDGKIYGVNANTGQLRTGWPVATGGPVRADPVADSDAKTISVGSNDGRLYSLYIGP